MSSTQSTHTACDCRGLDPAEGPVTGIGRGAGCLPTEPLMPPCGTLATPARDSLGSRPRRREASIVGMSTAMLRAPLATRQRRDGYPADLRTTEPSAASNRWPATGDRTRRYPLYGTGPDRDMNIGQKPAPQ